MPQFLGQFSAQEEHLEVLLREPGDPLEGPFCEHGLGAPASSRASLFSLPHGVTPCTPVAHFPLGL